MASSKEEGSAVLPKFLNGEFLVPVLNDESLKKFELWWICIGQIFHNHGLMRLNLPNFIFSHYNSL